MTLCNLQHSQQSNGPYRQYRQYLTPTALELKKCCKYMLRSIIQKGHGDPRMTVEEVLMG